MRITRPVTYDIQEPNHKRFIEDIYKIVQKNIGYGVSVQYSDNVQVNTNDDQNIDGAMCEITNTGAVNTEFVVTHNLERIPQFYSVKYINGNGVIYDSGTAWTTTQIFLKCSLVNAHIKLFIH